MWEDYYGWTWLSYDSWGWDRITMAAGSTTPVPGIGIRAFGRADVVAAGLVVSSLGGFEWASASRLWLGAVGAV